MTLDYSLPITIDEAQKSALDYVKKQAPEAQAEVEMVSAKLQDHKWLVEVSWPVQKKSGIQCAKVTVSESGKVEAYEKTRSSEDGKDGKHEWEDFIPLLVIFGVPSVILGVTVWQSARYGLSQIQFGTIIFFVFLLTVLGFLFSMKWLMWEENYDEAFGLPQGSIRTIIALTVVFFALFVGIFTLTIPNDIITLLAALVAFYFGATTAKPKDSGEDQTAKKSLVASPAPSSKTKKETQS